MQGIPRNIAISLALFALAATGVAGTAEARGGGAMNAAAAKVSRGAQMRMNRMKTKMALRTRGTLQQKTRRQLRLGKRKMMRAMSRRERGAPTTVQLMRASSRRDVGLEGSELERARERFAHDGVGRKPGDNNQEEEMERSVKQQKKMRDRSVRRATKAFEKLRRRNRN